MRGIVFSFTICLLLSTARANSYCSDSNDFYDIASGICRPCSEGKILTNGRCICGPNSIYVDGTCTLCSTGMIPDTYKRKCIKQCAGCNSCESEGGIIVTNDFDGTAFSESKCIKCAPGTILVGKETLFPRCEPCIQDPNASDPKSCLCKEPDYKKVGNTCLAQSYLDSLNPNIKSHIQMMTNKLGFYSSRFGTASLSNNLSDRSELFYWCFSEESSPACINLAQLCSIAANPDSGYCFSRNVDFTLFPAIKPTALTLQPIKVSEKIQIYVNIFSSQGRFRETKPLTGPVLGFSNPQKLEIEYGSQQILKEAINVTLTTETSFFEIIFVNSSGQLTHIPVISLTDRDSKPSLKEVGDLSQSTIEHFFFNQVGLSANSQTFIRYLSELTLVNLVEQSESSVPMIKPLLIAQYKDISIEEGKQGVDFQLTISFVTSLSSFWQTVIIVFAIVISAAVVLCFIGVFLKSRENPEIKAPATFIKEVFFWLVKMFAYFMTILMVGIWIFWMTKLGTPVIGQQILPNSQIFPREFLAFKILTLLVTLTLLIGIIWKLFRQTSINIKVIDWEKPNIVRTDGNQKAATTSMWRYMMFINELSEELRKSFINLGAVFLILLGVIEGVGLGRVAQTLSSITSSSFGFDPNATTLNEHTNVFLRFFLILVCNIVICFVIAVIKKIMSFFSGESFENIIDLCSVCNVSLVMVKDFNRAVYIHGKNIFQTGEGSLAVIYRKLELESLGYGGGRGIIPNDETQVFDVIEISGLKMEELDITEEIKKNVESAKIIIKEKNFFVSLFGLKTAGIIEKTEPGPRSANLLFFKERNSFVLKYFFRTFSEEIVILASFIVAIFDWICHSLVAGTVIAWVVCKGLEMLYGSLLLRNLTRNNKIDRRFLI